MSDARMHPKFVFAGVGTKGDTLPFLALGAELVRRGYAADLLATEGYAEAAARHGMGFFAVAPPQVNNLAPPERRLREHVFPMYEPTFEYFRGQVGGGRLVVINLDEFSATNSMCERYALPLCRVHLAPWRIRSLLRPAYPFNRRLAGRLGTTYRKHTLPQAYARSERAAAFIAGLNPYRERLGLGAIDGTRSIDALITLRIGLFPRWFAEPAPDWPAPFELGGFPLPAPSTPAPPELAAFVAREGRPLVFTPGTGVIDVDAFFEDARACCHALQRPGVFLSPHFRPSRGGLPHIIHYDYLELEHVLTHAALLVHHGGIGTVARALQAGVPQVIRPVAYDQFDNGDRVTTLEVGRSILPQHWSQPALIAAARDLLDNPHVQRRLTQLSRDIARSRPIAHVADVLERWFVPGGFGCTTRPSVSSLDEVPS